MKCYQHGLAGQPEAEWPPQVKANLAEAHFIHANALLGETRPAEAITHYLQALDLNKETLAFWAPADHASRRADVPELDPVCARAINNIGIAIRDTMDCEQAREIMARVQRLLPGLSWQETDTDRFCELDIGLALLNCALDLEPTLADAYISKDVILEDRGRFSEAHACCERALELAPESAEARFNLGISLLRMGELAKGWQDYEARLKLGTHIRKEHLQAAPLWRGEALVDQVLLVHAEQGLGDTIQFIRYYPEVAARCKKVILECEAPVKSLITNISGVTNVYAAGEPLPKFDLQIPLLSLPGIFGTRLDNIPASIPYILPDAAKAHEWHSIVSRQKGLKAGLVWAGSKTHKGNRFRSCSLAVFAPLAEVTGVSFFSLQKGEAAGEAGSAPAGMTLLDYSKQLEDFVDTAALVSQLDLVITVDTSVAHLAGAMGKPVWVLVPFCPDWRWLLDREDSPWYPSMRLFRQTAIGDWGEGIERIKQELSRLSAGMGEHTL
jgi:tetratricopeptide (TPR) repeat protein